MAKQGQLLLDAVYEYMSAHGEWPADMEAVLDLHPELRRIAGWHYGAPGRSGYSIGDWHYRKENDGGFRFYRYAGLMGNSVLLYRVARAGDGSWYVIYADSGFVRRDIPAGKSRPRDEALKRPSDPEVEK